MGSIHTHIGWIDARSHTTPSIHPALVTYLLPFGFALQESNASERADVCLVMADRAQQAYTHADFIRARQMGQPIVVILTQAQALDRVALLDHGADDCMVQPIEQRELAARLHALRRRKLADEAHAHKHWVRFGPWLLDTEQRQLSDTRGTTVTLSAAEYSLLLAFLSLPYQVLSPDQWMDEARGRGLDAFDRGMDLLVARLRFKLGDDPRWPRLIQTVRGQGYLFNASPHLPVSARVDSAPWASGLTH
ncbi:MAG TPA: response regulator transcription factor [Aquabacterium sp.]|nr:response regulator transcription factor [Aquabacterium sp.]